MIYNNLELLKPENKQLLFKDISGITGRVILKVRIRRIDSKKKIAMLDISYRN